MIRILYNIYITVVLILCSYNNYITYNYFSVLIIKCDSVFSNKVRNKIIFIYRSGFFLSFYENKALRQSVGEELENN